MSAFDKGAPLRQTVPQQMRAAQMQTAAVTKAAKAVVMTAAQQMKAALYTAIMKLKQKTA